MSLSGGTVSPGSDERESQSRRGPAVRQALGPGVLASQRPDDPQLTGRQRQAELQRERPLNG